MRLSLLAALDRLPPKARAVVVLRYWEDLSVEATAAALGCSTGTVKSQSSRALARLRALLGDGFADHRFRALGDLVWELNSPTPKGCTSLFDAALDDVDLTGDVVPGVLTGYAHRVKVRRYQAAGVAAAALAAAGIAVSALPHGGGATRRHPARVRRVLTTAGTSTGSVTARPGHRGGGPAVHGSGGRPGELRGACRRPCARRSRTHG